MKRDVYMGACEASPLKRSRDEIAEVEEEMKCKKRRNLIKWKLPSNRMLMEKAVREVLATGKSTYVSKKIQDTTENFEALYCSGTKTIEMS